MLCLLSSVGLSVRERKKYNTEHDRSGHVHVQKNPISLSNTFVSHVTVHMRSAPAFKKTATVCVCVCARESMHASVFRFYVRTRACFEFVPKWI